MCVRVSLLIFKTPQIQQIKSLTDDEVQGDSKKNTW